MIIIICIVHLFIDIIITIIIIIIIIVIITVVITFVLYHYYYYYYYIFFQFFEVLLNVGCACRVMMVSVRRAQSGLSMQVKHLVMIGQLAGTHGCHGAG